MEEGRIIQYRCYENIQDFFRVRMANWAAVVQFAASVT